jgi:hypothetical protein
MFDLMPIHYLITFEILVILIGLWWLNLYKIELLILVCVLVLTSISAEFFFRIKYFGLNGLHFGDYCPADYGHPLSNFTPDQITYTGLKPNENIVFKGAQYSTNSLGFRGKSYPFEKSDDVYRIITIGASIIVGVGVDDDARFVSIIEKTLNDMALPKRIEVIDLSIPGSTLGNRVHVLENIGIKYNPDIILFRLNPPDHPEHAFVVRQRKMPMDHLTMPDLIFDQKWNLLSQRFFFANLIWSKSKSMRTNFEWDLNGIKKIVGIKTKRIKNDRKPMNYNSKKILGKENTESTIEKALKKISTTLSSSNIILLTLRPLKKLKDENLHQGYRQKMLELAQKLKMGFIDTYDLNLSSFRRQELFIYPGDNHPNEIVHRHLGEFISDKLLPYILIEA